MVMFKVVIKAAHSEYGYHESTHYVNTDIQNKAEWYVRDKAESQGWKVRSIKSNCITVIDL